MGRLEEARQQIETVLKHSDRRLPLLNALQAQLQRDRHFDEAIALGDEMKQRFPSSYMPELGLAWVHFAAGDSHQALRELTVARGKEDSAELLGMVGYALAVNGDRKGARDVLEQLRDARFGYVIPYFVARIYAGLDEKNEALDWLDQAYEDRNENLVNADYGGLRTDLAWKSLQDEPRFITLLKKVGLDNWPVPVPLSPW